MRSEREDVATALAAGFFVGLASQRAPEAKQEVLDRVALGGAPAVVAIPMLVIGIGSGAEQQLRHGCVTCLTSGEQRGHAGVGALLQRIRPRFQCRRGTFRIACPGQRREIHQPSVPPGDPSGTVRRA